MATNIQYQFTPVPFTAVQIADPFWSPRIETNRTVTVPYDFQKCEETDRISNFEKAAGRLPGDHVGIFFNDSDVYKVIEGAAYALHLHPDPALEQYVDDLIDKIAAAQEPDGYLYTARTIAERNGTPEKLRADREGLTRWSNLKINHEFYNVGHLYEAAVAYVQATGKRTLLDVALKNADLIASLFGPGQLRYPPGHQEIEIGLVKLYHVTSNERYLKLAKAMLDERGRADGHVLYGPYAQDHLPVTEQDEAVGHAVRAVYMYAGMADVATLTGDQAYIDAIDRIWENVVAKKFYITGGIGARHEGEAFGENYELPNATAYNETCAAIANIYWNQRLFQLHGDAKYIDVLERSLYNGFLPGVAFSGDRFFYVNPLEFDGNYRFNRDDSLVRLGWFNCSCCPTNVVRVFPALGGYVYAQTADRLYVNLFMGSQATLNLAGTPVQVSQQTEYPWQGTIQLTVQPQQPVAFTLCVRIPGWAQGQPVPSDLYHYVDASSAPATITVNGQSVALTLNKGYAQLQRTWQAGDVVEVTLPMPIRRVVSHPNVKDTADKVAVERGPLVYCAEGVDNGGHVLDKVLEDGATISAEFKPALLNGVTVLQVQKPAGDLLLVPYYTWAHRGVGEMTVWFKRNQQ
ncbi:MAG: glycoside hydrolase family 127 protein [Caldilineaceae bacterium]